MTENNLNDLKSQLANYEDLLVKEEAASMHYTLNVIGCKAMIENIKKQIKEAETPSN